VKNSSQGTTSTLQRALVLLLFAVGAWGAEERIPVILSTDVGNEVDDQWAIVYLLTQPRFDVQGIVSAHAPTIAPPAGHTSYKILVDVVENRLSMKQHPPLYEGASLPLEDAKTPRASDGVDFLIETSKKFSPENRLTVLTIGAATDAASAILQDPSITGRIQIIDMGFKKWPEGGDEFNVANDVKAMQVILASDVPLTIGSGDVCRASLSLLLDQAKELIADKGPIGKWLWQEFQGWYYRFVKPMRKDDLSKPWVIWDNITLAHALGMTSSETYPRPKLKDDMTFEHPRSEKTITWITDVDEQRMWQDFLLHLDRYQRTHAVGLESDRTFLLLPPN
jgi:inosine-uridine nucleoside N-ribohydrolase